MYTATRRHARDTDTNSGGKVAVNMSWKQIPCKEKFRRYNTLLLRNYHSGCERVKLLINVGQMRYTQSFNGKTAKDEAT